MIRQPPRSPLFPYTPLFRSYGAGFRSFLELGASIRGQEYASAHMVRERFARRFNALFEQVDVVACPSMASAADRKSTRLNSSHSQISYAVFCLKKKKETPPYLSRSSSDRTNARTQRSAVSRAARLYAAPLRRP